MRSRILMSLIFLIINDCSGGNRIAFSSIIFARIKIPSNWKMENDDGARMNLRITRIPLSLLKKGKEITFRAIIDLFPTEITETRVWEDLYRGKNQSVHSIPTLSHDRYFRIFYFDSRLTTDERKKWTEDIFILDYYLRRRTPFNIRLSRKLKQFIDN